MRSALIMYLRTLYYCFNQPIGVGVLPPILTHLTIGRDFNQRIGVGVLPPTLKNLVKWKF